MENDEQFKLLKGKLKILEKRMEKNREKHNLIYEKEDSGNRMLLDFNSELHEYEVERDIIEIQIVQVEYEVYIKIMYVNRLKYMILLLIFPENSNYLSVRGKDGQL